MNERFGGCVSLAPRFGESLWPKFTKELKESAAAGTGAQESFVALRIREKIKVDRVALTPKAGDLQDGGPADSAMGKEQGLGESTGIAVRDDGDREPAKLPQRGQF